MKAVCLQVHTRRYVVRLKKNNSFPALLEGSSVVCGPVMPLRVSPIPKEAASSVCLQSLHARQGYRRRGGCTVNRWGGKQRGRAVFTAFPRQAAAAADWKVLPGICPPHLGLRQPIWMQAQGPRCTNSKHRGHIKGPNQKTIDAVLLLISPSTPSLDLPQLLPQTRILPPSVQRGNGKVRRQLHQCLYHENTVSQYESMRKAWEV